MVTLSVSEPQFMLKTQLPCKEIANCKRLYVVRSATREVFVLIMN